MPIVTAICFFSDLHMLAKRSNATQHLPGLRRMAAESDVVVLGGDIFDFKWSTEVSLDASIRKAIAWTRDFVSESPTTQFKYLLGNHDCIPAFVFELESLANRMDNFCVEPYILRFGDSVCLH
ncbi:MAG: metallophosphoesterase, partial [Planctomycetota bacterium]